ncbi:MAG: hypothetical protein MUO26_12650 [Methanotrichaceae archaeon]|nr:hypothetical protein [Methanotrichaceae archaeon]
MSSLLRGLLFLPDTFSVNLHTFFAYFALHAAINILYRGLNNRGISLRLEDSVYEKEDGTRGLRDGACIDLADYWHRAGSL